MRVKLEIELNNSDENLTFTNVDYVKRINKH